MLDEWAAEAEAELHKEWFAKLGEDLPANFKVEI